MCGREEEIERVRQLDDENYQASGGGLGDSATLVQDLVDLYQFLGDLVRAAAAPAAVPERIVAAVQFTLGCRYHLVMGALTLLRGHRGDSASHTRRAMELCAFAARVRAEPGLLEVWARAADSDEAFAAYRREFRTRDLFPRDDPILGRLYERYDLASKQSHPSVYSLAGHIQFVREEGAATEVRFQYYDVSPDNPGAFVGTYLFLLDTHLQIFRVLEAVFADEIAHDRRTWDLRRNAVDAKLRVHKERWRPLVTAAAGQVNGRRA